MKSDRMFFKATALAAMAIGFVTSAGDFAGEVIEYLPAPGQFINNSSFNDPTDALGPPSGGGTTMPNNSGVVSLGGFGGSITLRFTQTVLDDPRNPGGYDFIIYSNATWLCVDGACTAGNPNRRFAEPAVVEIARDVNGNGVADDPWFVIPGSSMSDAAAALRTQQWDDDINTETPPANPLWYPDPTFYPGFPASYATMTFELPPELAATEAPYVLDNPNGPDATTEAHWGYAELNPTLRLGDLSGAVGASGENSVSDPEDAPGADPGAFYTWPDDPFVVGICRGSGGGDAFDIAWAVDPITGEPANLDGFDFVRISTAIDAMRGPFGEGSAEIDAVADVRAVGDASGDDVVGTFDLAALLGAWGTNDPAADFNRDGIIDARDLGALLGSWGGPVHE